MSLSQPFSFSRKARDDLTVLCKDLQYYIVWQSEEKITVKSGLSGQNWE